ncbi:MAG: serine/threonine-protein kinase, partial [Planctomycetota bacterium]
MSSARSERQRRVWSVLEGALGLPPGERAAFVRAHAGDDPSLVSDVLDALERDESLGTEVSRGHAEALRSLEVGLAPGTVVGERYELIEEVGRGAMGVVFRARHLDLGRDVAVKLLPPGDGYESILREGRRIAEVEHDGVVQVIDVGAHGTAPFLVMEWLAGFDLRAWLLASRSADSGSPEERLAHFIDRRSSAAAPVRDAAKSYWRFTATALRDVARAVAHAHAHGIAHQDVSPKNVVVTDAGRVSLVDFGLAVFLGGRRGEGDSPHGGTRAYAAPEHLTAAGGAAHDGVESLILNDVYGIGATLLHLVTGLSPTELPRPARGFRTAVRFGGDTASGAVVPRDLLQIAWKATSPEPAERYRGAAALADDLDRFLSFRPVTAEAPSWLHLASLWWKRDRRQVALAALAVTIIGLLGYVVEGRLARAGEANALERATALGERYTQLPVRFGLNADPRVAFEHSSVESAEALEAAGAILTDAPWADALRLRRAWAAARAGDTDLVQGDRRALESRHPGSTLLGRFFDRLESDDPDIRHAGLLQTELAPCTSGLDHALAAMARSGHRGARDAIRADAAIAVAEDPRDFVSAELLVYCAMVDGDPDAWRGPEARPIADALATRSTPTVLHGRAFAVRRSDPGLARELWEELLALDPKSYYARHNLIDLDVRAQTP